MIITQKSQNVGCSVWSQHSFLLLSEDTENIMQSVQLLFHFSSSALELSDKILWTGLFVIVCGLKLSFTRLAASHYSFHFNTKCHCVLPKQTFKISDILHMECFIWPEVKREYFAIQPRSVGLYDGYGVSLLRGKTWIITL